MQVLCKQEMQGVGMFVSLYEPYTIYFKFSMALLLSWRTFSFIVNYKDDPTLCENHHVDKGQTKQIGAIVNAHAYYLPSLNVYQHPIKSSAIVDCWAWAEHG
jgi:hypothetical protein